MPRNMSFMLTTEQYIGQTKTVTRRLGWGFLKIGEILNGVVKAQGLKKGEKIKRIGQHYIIGIRKESLRRMIDDLEYGQRECILEGFPDLMPEQFVQMFCEHNKCTSDVMVNRIEFDYLPAYAGEPGALGE